MTTGVLDAGKIYHYRIRVIYTTNAYTTGIGFALAFSSPPTVFTFRQQLPLANNAAEEVPFRTRTENTTVVSTATGTDATDDGQPYCTELFGHVVTNAATNMSLRVKSELASTQVKVLKGTVIELLQVS